jgi:hypothetical protein
MGFVTPALLGGAALIALPIVLHLIMRREALKLRFPALRFVQQRRTMNQHRLRLRHWLLLALRCAIIALLAFALARPTLRGAGAAGKEGAPVASAFVFDNSSRMNYQHANQSRLGRAKELAAWLLEQLPADAPVTVVDRAGRLRGQDLDRSAAELRVERLESSPAVRPMEDALRDAMRWLEDKPDYRGEIYVFTDLATEAWPPEMRSDLAKRLDELKGTNLYVIDVGVDEPHNFGLSPLRLSSERLAPGSMLRINTDLLAAGAGSKGGAAGRTQARELVVELYVGADPSSAEKRGQHVVTPSAGDAAPIEFLLSGLELGTHQGFVRIVGSDGLAEDDIRYFSVDVRPPIKVLLLGEDAGDTLFLREALAPSAAPGPSASRFTCQVGQLNELGQLSLADFAAVLLVDPSPLSSESWKTLVNYAESGGGIGVFLGRHARANEMNQAEPQQLLPAKLRWASHEVTREPTFLRPVAVEHPALTALRDLADTVPWSEFPVFKYWELEAGAQNSHVVATFANGKPAIVERQIGTGRVLMMTTPVSDPAYDDPWNLLPTAPEPWPFLVLANGVAQYLAGAGDAQQNYLAGQTVIVRLAPEEQVASYVLQMPAAGPDDRTSSVRQTLTPGQQDVSIAATDTVGNYRLRAGGRGARLDRGFSVNLPPEISRLDRTVPNEITKSLGEGRTRIARTQEEIELRVGLGRVGRELFPALIVAVALVLAAEQLLANRFYKGGPSATGTQLSARNTVAQTILPTADSRQPSAGDNRPIRNPQSRPVVLEPADIHP